MPWHKSTTDTVQITAKIQNSSVSRSKLSLCNIGSCAISIDMYHHLAPAGYLPDELRHIL